MNFPQTPDQWRTGWEAFAAPEADPRLWTVVIPAAGRGSRLGFEKPKILFPLAGRTILDWLLDLFEGHIGSFVLVLSPSGRPFVEPELEKRLGSRFKIAIQEVPTGMGDAVEIGLNAVQTPHTAVVWGDQVAIRPESVEAMLRLHSGPIAPAITCPTVWRDNPYIHFPRNSEGRLQAVLQAREGDSMPVHGESDTGFFCFDTARLRRLLAETRDEPERLGAKTREFNLLPVIPLASRRGETVLTPLLMTLEETVGVNTPADAAYLEGVLGRS